MSVEPRPCCELGEESSAAFTKLVCPELANLKHLSCYLQQRYSLLTASLLRINTSGHAVTKRVGVDLQNLLARFFERVRQATQPANESPDQRMRNGWLVPIGVHFVANPETIKFNGAAISDPAVFKKRGGA